METIGERIEHLRYKNNLTLQDLSKHLGISKTAVRKYETGDTKKIKYENIEKLANLFNVTTDYLLKGEEENPEDKFIRLLIDKTIDNKLKWENIQDYEHLEIDLNISNINIDVDKLKSDLDLFGIGYISKLNETYFIIFEDMDADNPENYILQIQFYYGKNLANFNNIGFASTQRGDSYHEAGNPNLIELYKVVSDRSEYLKELELNDLIDDLENL